MAMVEPYNAIPYPAWVKNVAYASSPLNFTRICGSTSAVTDGGDGHTQLYAYNGTAWKGVEEAYVIDESEQWNRIATGFNEFERKLDGSEYIPNGASTPHADGWYEVTEQISTGGASFSASFGSGFQGTQTNNFTINDNTGSGGPVATAHTIGRMRIVLTMWGDNGGVGTSYGPNKLILKLKAPTGATTLIWPGIQFDGPLGGSTSNNNYMSRIFGNSHNDGWIGTYVIDSRAAGWGAHSMLRWIYDGDSLRGYNTDNAYLPRREDFLSGYGTDNRTSPAYSFWERNEGTIDWYSIVASVSGAEQTGFDGFEGSSVTGTWKVQFSQTAIGQAWNVRMKVYIKPE